MLHLLLQRVLVKQSFPLPSRESSNQSQFSAFWTNLTLSDVLFWFVLVWFVLFCFGLVWFVLFCFVLFCFVLFCFVLFCFVLFCFVLICFVLFCVTFACLFMRHQNVTTNGFCEIAHRSCQAARKGSCGSPHHVVAPAISCCTGASFGDAAVARPGIVHCLHENVCQVCCGFCAEVIPQHTTVDRDQAQAHSRRAHSMKCCACIFA
jgi:hypothetical protein